jgi:hypothetical protein
MKSYENKYLLRVKRLEIKQQQRVAGNVNIVFECK